MYFFFSFYLVCNVGYGGMDCSVEASEFQPGCTDVSDTNPPACTAVDCGTTMLDMNNDITDGCEVICKQNIILFW